MYETGDEIVNKLLKLVVIGDGASGKTSLINHFVHGHCVKEYHQTLGIEFYMRPVILSGGGGRTVNVQVWDIGGQALGGKMLDKYLNASDGILLIYDITNENSFDNLEDWLAVVRSVPVRRLPPHLYLVANKCDLEHLRLVKAEKHQRFAQVNGLKAHTVSARTGEAVNACFQRIVADILGLSLMPDDEDAGAVPQKVLVAEIAREPPRAMYAECAAATRSSSVCALQ